ncbi:uncharacterized protein [Mycetomoellerius zeteki]|uniref:uncharacterized protein isoform X1 n=1 Tax=Mycetomoellerius zeteki TaxID=64791 RepID=UPI00084EA4B3|nr:PREDICTED: uncharacterized protein LOC108720780 isoform X1 [Trachymyrmex zeteki]
MAQLISVKLSRFDGSPWGFRLQGGKDFGTPLIVQKVNSGSPAEAAGLKAGDAVIRVNTTDMYNLRHKDAQDVIVKAGNNFEITVQRGGSTWKPHVTPATTSLPSPMHTASTGNITPVTKTSLAAKKQDGPLIGSGHNFSPKPFLNGTGDGPIKSIVNKQYNSPVGIYSEETIAETLSAQAEVLAGGVLGVNFKKNERNYNAENSEVFKMVQEADKEPKTPEPVPSRTEFYSSVSHAVGGRATSPRSPTPLFHAMGGGGSAPADSRHFVWMDESYGKNREPQPQKQESSAGSGSSTPGGVVCCNCDRVIVGVFVRIKDKNLHVECFKCSTCGTSLKNVGYYNINNKLYCDIHAKLVARQNAPAGLVPLTIPPGGKAPASTISAALASAPLSPPLSNHGSSPQPFSACNRTSPESGFQHTWRSTSNTNGCIKNDECNGESKTFTSTITIQTGGTEPTTRFGTPPVDSPSLRSVQAPTSNNLVGPKPFGGSSGSFSSNLSPTPTLNSGSNTLPRPQSQTVTETSNSETYERSYYHEVVENTKDQSFRPGSVRSRRSLLWPPPKSIEDITYPTASPLYINPNPVLDKTCYQIKEKRASIEACERALSRRTERHRSESIDREVEKVLRENGRRHETDVMDRLSCSGQPVYRRIELWDTNSRTSRSDVTTSRPSSTDSVRRSLTPTRIVQPTPKPWTATVSSGGTNLYQQSYAISAEQEQPAGQIYKKFMQREVCRERISGGKEHREEQRAYRTEICRREQICPKPPLPAPKQEPAETVKEIDTEVTNLRGDETDEGEVSKGIQGEHDFITETAEETVDGMHTKQSATFEKTVERVSSPMERSNVPMIEEAEDKMESQCFARRTEKYIDRKVEDTTERTVEESAEMVTSAIDTQQMLEKAKQEEEKRKKEEEEEERRKEEEERRKREEEEQRRQEEEEKRKREEEEKNKKHVTFNEEDEEIEEVREQPLGRTVVREERITESDGSTPGRCKITKETYEEITEEVLVQERVKKRGAVEDERRKSLREQVEVHQSLRDQQAPERRNVVARYGQQPQETMESCKKKVQFLKETETGPKPLSDTPVKNSTPKEWKSEMVNALTTVSDRPYTPLNATSSVKELYTEETIYLDHRCRPKPPPKEEIRPISPFQQALTIAPERSYTPLSREIGPEDQQIVTRSQTPSLQLQNTEYCPPLGILYGKEDTTRESYAREQIYMKKKVKESRPRPLPTPPPDHRLRDSSASPAARPHPETPKSSKSFTADLKKPDAIPAYQKNLVAMKKGPVEGQPFIPSRTPTPTPRRSKSPAQGPPEPPACYVKTRAPRIREDPPPPKRGGAVHFPSRKTISYHVEEDTDSGHRKQEYSASRTVNYDEKETNSLNAGPTEALYAQFQETRCMTSEETSEQKNTATHVKKALQVVEDYEKCQQKEILPAASPPQKPKPSICAISKVSHTKPTLSCPMTTTSAPVRPTYSSSTEVRHVRYETPSPKPCPETGVTVLPCKAHSDQGIKAGVVVVPCNGSQTCSRSGICVTATKDRSGVCVSPSFGMRSGTCGQPSGTCGRESSCDFNISNCPNSDICVTPCADGSVCVAPCKKLGPNQSKANLPFPQIPLPYEEITPPAPQCSAPSFKPRTNLSGQLARLTAKNGQSNVPMVQLYKPIQTEPIQTQTPQAQSYTENTYYHTQSYRETHCESGNHCQNTQNRCQDQIHCDPLSETQNLVDPPNLSSHPDLGTGIGGLGSAGSKSGSFAGSSAPKRGRGILNQAVGAGSRIPLCAHCNSYVRGPFITALGQIWCPDHFVCVNAQCRRPLQDIGFVEEKGQLYCEYCFEKFIAPTCNKCNNKIKGDCLNAIGKHFHPECFNCAYCGKLFGNNPFFLEEGLPYCEADWNELFTTKCFACGFPVEVGDRWVEALNNNYHSQCFNCTMCKKNLEGQSFYAKGGRPFCKNHAR